VLRLLFFLSLPIIVN